MTGVFSVSSLLNSSSRDDERPSAEEPRSKQPSASSSTSNSSNSGSNASSSTLKTTASALPHQNPAAMAARQAPAPTIASAPPAATATNSIHNPAAAASARHHHHHHHHHHHAVTSSYQHQPGTNPGTAPGPIHGPSTAPSSAAAGGMAHPAQGTHLAYPHQQRAQQHVHASMLARTDYRYWPYPQYLQYAHMPPPPPPIPPPSAPGMSTSMTTPWRRERRSKACLRCHTKKIKCEGEGPTCEGCRQAGCECKWVEMKKRGPKPKSKNNGPQRTNNRGSGAETEPSPMPSSKSLRHAPPNNPPGTRGTASGLGVVAPSSAPIVLPSDPAIVSGVRPEANPPATPKIPAPPAPAPSNMDAVMDRFFSPEVPADIRDAVVCYFDYFYGRIPIFHPASFVRRVVEGSVDELLLDTMKAYTARVVMQQTGRHIDIDTITASVRRRLLTGLDRPTIDYVRAVVLASALSGGESKFMSYNSLACLASSLVTRLGWHTLDLDSRSEDVSWDTWVEQEIKRRTFWAVYQLDSYQSLMADRPMTIDPSRIYISTPGSDYTWDDISVPQILHWPTRHQLDISRDTIIRTGALSYTFIELCNIMNIVCQMNEFLWNVKLTISARLRGSLRSSDIRFLQFPPLPNLNATKGEPVTTMFQYPEFVRLHTALLSWRDSLVPAESMRTMSCTPMTDFRRFGSTENRRFAMRVRYFCLRCYHTAIFLLLHLSNRPSFFNPQQPSLRTSPLPFLPPTSATTRTSVESIGSSPTPDVCDEDRVLRNLMSTAFSEMLNDGYLAYDIEKDSWDLCLEEIYNLCDHLVRNSDIPIDRCDASISFCLFTSITVLIRQARKVRQELDDSMVSPIQKDTTTVNTSSSTANGSSTKQDSLRDELSKCTSTLRRMWNMLKDLGFIWTVKGMEHLLRSMQVEEIANATNLFSGLSL